MKVNYKIKTLYYILIIICICKEVKSQTAKKVQFVGVARSIMNSNELVVKDPIEDTVTAKKKMGGYALIDLGVNIFPNKNTEILGMMRIRNAFGGFYGAGVTFDVRQLYVKGIIGNVVRYQLGDINYKLTPFTFYNHDEDQLIQQPDVFKLQREIVNYETFYQKNTWRQQGAAVDFALEFAKGIKEIKFNGFINRINVTDFTNVPDRFYGGGNIGIQQSKNLFVGFNYVSLFDLIGTSSNKNAFCNNVASLNYELQLGKDNIDFRFFGETGFSESKYTLDTLAPKLDDSFLDLGISFSYKPLRTKLTLGYLDVGPDFRSAGAQSKRMNYNATPSVYDRYTNQQGLSSIGIFDMMRDETLYNKSISNNLMAFNPAYNNVMPFGIATFNRQGVYAKLDFLDKKEIVKIGAESYLLNEIKGQGTEILKSFNLIKSNAELNIHKLLALKKTIKITAGFATQSTKRSSDLDFEKINLTSNNWKAGFEVEFYKNFDLLGGIISYEANGNEMIADRNKYTEVTDFNEYKINTSEMILGGGLRYRFSDKIYLTTLYQNYDFKNKLNSVSSYSINQLLIIYNMKF